MSKEVSLVLAISILIALLTVFVVSFILYKKTPVPKGCEDLKISEEKCGACSNNKDCSIYVKSKEDK